MSKGPIGSDIDGTLLDYNYSEGAPTINYKLIQQWRNRSVILITNQGGLAFGVQGLKRKDGRPYPTPELFLSRLDALVKTLRSCDIAVPLVYVSLYHDNAPISTTIRVRDILEGEFVQRSFGGHIHISKFYRKPNRAMLLLAGISVYYGDSDEDEEAAKNAGVEFVRVSRFW